MSTKSPLDVVGDPTRRSIIDRLHVGPASVGEIAAGLPISRPAVSQHLAVLKAAGLVGERRAGTRRIYRLDVGGLEPVRAWIESLSAPPARAAAARSAAAPAPDGALAAGPAKDRKKHKKHGKK